MRIDPGQFPKLLQEAGCREDADRRLKVGPVELLAKLAAELAVETHVDVGIGEPRNVLDVGAEREGEVHLAADPLDEPADLREV